MHYLNLKKKVKVVIHGLLHIYAAVLLIFIKCYMILLITNKCENHACMINAVFTLKLSHLHFSV